MKRVSVLLVMVALIAAMAGCQPALRYDLTVSSTTGGSVTSPGEGTFTYDRGTTVLLVAAPASGYQFVNWTGNVGTIANVDANGTTITMNDNCSITANFEEIPPVRYDLTISSTYGGSVTTPGEGTFNYDCGTGVELVAEAEEGYAFVGWTGDVGSIRDINAAATSIALNSDCSISARFGVGIYDWYDLDAIRDNLCGRYILMNALDYTTTGYTEMASRTASQGKGWEPIGTEAEPFTGAFHGQGYEIRDVFVDRPDEGYVGLFGWVGSEEVIQDMMIQDIGVVNIVAAGTSEAGGLIGVNWRGTVTNCYSTGRVTGEWGVGGLVGHNLGTVSDSYSSCSVTGAAEVGGLIGSRDWGGTVRNSYYNYDEVLINGKNMITIGALFKEDFELWLAGGKSLDVNERLCQQNGYYLISDVSDLKELLAFGQDGSLRFRLEDNVDLATEPNFYIPYLAGEFDGNGHEIRNLSFTSEVLCEIGLFGYLEYGGKVDGLGARNINITGDGDVGALVGWNDGSVAGSYAIGSVTGNWGVGGLVGQNCGTVRDSYFAGRVTSQSIGGGLVGGPGIVSNSYYNYDEVLINGRNVITIGALFREDFERWLADGKSLDVNERLSQEEGYYVISDISDLKQLLAFGWDGSLKFRLENDLDLATEPNFYVPYLAGEFDGNGHSIRNLGFRFGFAACVGLFGYLAPSGRVSDVSAENVDITGANGVGGLVGWKEGTVSSSYSTGSVTGTDDVGGLVGFNGGTVRNSYSDCRVNGRSSVGGLLGRHWGGTVSNSYSTGSASGERQIGGLVGWNDAIVSNCYSTSSVTGEREVGGLVGLNNQSVSNSYSIGIVTGISCVGGLVGSGHGVVWGTGTSSQSFWDVTASLQTSSAGGTGRTTAEMKNIATFADAVWSIIAVADPSTRNPAYIWNMMDGQTYPFLSWQPIS